MHMYVLVLLLNAVNLYDKTCAMIAIRDWCTLPHCREPDDQFEFLGSEVKRSGTAPLLKAARKTSCRFEGEFGEHLPLCHKRISLHRFSGCGQT